MKVATSVVLIALAGCAGEQSDAGGGGTNPPTLWFAEGSGGTMKLVAEEPRPY